MSAKLSLVPQTGDIVVLNSTTRFPYLDVANFLREAEKLRKSNPSALYCAVLASSYSEPLGNYIEHFPSEHPWLVDARQELVAKRVVRIFYRPSIPQIDRGATMKKIEGIISSFTFDDESRRLELMELFEAII